MWWIFGATLLYLEIFSIGIALISKTLGEKRWFLAFVPIYGLTFVNKVAGAFKVLSIPVKKFAAFTAELFVVILLCCAYWQWGIDNVAPKGAKYLGQIMILPVAICYILLYIALLKASLKIYKRFYVQKLGVTMLVSLLLIPIPFILCGIRNNEAQSLSEMFG